ncbi:MAG: Magnesium transporter MgtE [Pseudomonadota bacterium]
MSPLTLVREIAVLDDSLALERLKALPPEVAGQVLRGLSPVKVESIFATSEGDDRAKISALVPPHVSAQWDLNRSFPEGTVGRLMDPPLAVMSESLTVGQAKEELRGIVRSEFVTYGYLVDAARRLTGVLVMRDLLFADDATPVNDIMVRNPFRLMAGTPLMDAMKEVLVHHFPVYPVCDEEGRILGLVRGYRLFETQAFEIIAQAGRMVGVDNEEQISTPIIKSFKFRHPWLQLNLLTAFVAGAVVSLFQDTIDKVVVLAAFLPVLAGQSGNTGCQALAVTLRAMTLGDLKDGAAGKAVRKEALLGLSNGLLVGVSAGVGMYLLANGQGHPDALTLSLIVVIAMTGSCAVSGISGALVPLALKRLGADPATASSIFLTTATDVASMGLLLGLATWLLL